MALARVLLTEPDSALYRPANPDELYEATREALSALGPDRAACDMPEMEQEMPARSAARSAGFLAGHVVVADGVGAAFTDGSGGTRRTATPFSGSRWMLLADVSSVPIDGGHVQVRDGL